MAIRYDPLDFDRYETRIITLLPGSGDSIVRCTLETITLQSPATYDALSYCWGDANSLVDISVNGETVSVTRSLERALRRLREMGATRLWADALCIDQQNEQEKGMQIRNMRTIYMKADKTYAWLGEEASHGTIDFLLSLFTPHIRKGLSESRHVCASPLSEQELQQSGNQINNSCPRCKVAAQLQGVQKLLGCPYWKRRWIIQESCVSSSHMILYGNEYIMIEDLERAIQYYQGSFDWNITTRSTCQWYQKVMNFRHLYRTSAGMALCQAIYWSRGFESTERKDAIFAFVGLCYDRLELIPTSNYSDPVSKINLELTFSLIRRYRRLDVALSYATAPNGRSYHPSWAPQWLDEATPSIVYNTAKLMSSRDYVSFGLSNQLHLGVSDMDHVRLRVQATTLGKVISMTSSTNPANTAIAHPQQSSNSTVPATGAYRSAAESGNMDSSKYYDRDDIASALLFCVLPASRERHFRQRKPRKLHKYIRYTTLSSWRDGIIWKELWQFLSAKHALGDGLDQMTHSFFPNGLSRWLKTNASFRVQGHTLEQLTRTGPAAAFAAKILETRRNKLTAVIALVTAALAALVPVIRLPLYGLALTLAILIPSMAGATILAWGQSVQDRLAALFSDVVEAPIDPWQRLVLADRGFLGMAPDLTQEGDEIFYLKGCQYAVVLRAFQQQGTPRDNRMPQYSLIGRVYVYFTEDDRLKYCGPDPELPDFPRLYEEWLSGPKSWTLTDIELI